MYKGRTVLQKVVGHPSCVFLYNPPGVGSQVLQPQQVVFPSPAELPDQKQLRYTEEVLQHVAPGLQLELAGVALWARRMGKCKVYWEVGSSQGSASPSTPARLLERNYNTPIFDFSIFFRGQLRPAEGPAWRVLGPPLPHSPTPSCRAGGVPSQAASRLTPLHHLPGLWAGPVS